MSFGPVLVRDGQVLQCEWYPVGEIDRGYSRAGIGQVDKLHYLYMSLNHSPEQTARWSVNEFARHFGEKPVVNAYCLDGGQTGELVFQGRAYNHVDWGNERPVSDNIYFATAIGGTEVSE
jgi:exopolysaccharide biosynthesis protein